MIGLLIIILLVAAIPLGILLFVIKSTESERSRPPAGRGVSALYFGAASFLGIVIIALSAFGPNNAFAGLLLVSIPIMGITALLASSLHGLMVKSSKLIAALVGGGIALAAILIFTLFLAIIIAPNTNAGVFVMALGSMMVLVPFGIPLFLLGALAGLAINRLSKETKD